MIRLRDIALIITLPIWGPIVFLVALCISIVTAFVGVFARMVKR